MRTEEEIRKIESNIRAYLEDGLFRKGDYRFLADFYLKTAKKTLLTADALMQLSENKELKQKLKLLDDFETYLWVVTTSYYSMFYAVNGLFAKHGIKIGDRIAHKVTSDVFYHHFIRNNKIARELFEIYEEAKERAMDLASTAYQGEAEELSQHLESEMRKRHKFQYNMTKTVKRGYAQTSLKRAVQFITQIEVLTR